MENDHETEHEKLMETAGIAPLCDSLPNQSYQKQDRDGG